MLQAVRMASSGRMCLKMQSQVRDERLLVPSVLAVRHGPCHSHALHNGQCAAYYITRCLRRSIDVESQGHCMGGLPAVVDVQLRLHEVSWMQRSFPLIGPPGGN